jgi:Holliday junction resolvasome RuvABC endonuclease subunit
MSARRPTLARTLGIAPTTRGFAWVAFSGPLSLYDWGSVFVRSDKNLRCVQHFERLLDKLQPELVVMEAPSTQVLRTRRVEELQRLLKSSAFLKNVDVATYRKDQVQHCFATVGAQSRYEIAEAVARNVPDLAHKIPRKRAAWMSEDRRMAIFTAAALVLTHFHIDGNEFVEGMKPAA